MIENPFTQSWIQALTLAADNPVARTIKSKLDWIDRLSQLREDANRKEAAQALWDYAAAEGLTDLLHIVPTAQSNWEFSPNDIFLFERRVGADDKQPSTRSFEGWKQSLGLEPTSFPLTAEVTHGDWMGLVRSEAVRLQKSPSMGSGPQATTLHLPCMAHWDTQSWTVQFDQLDWIVVAYEDALTVRRPTLAEIEETLTWALARANDSVVAKTATACTPAKSTRPWIECVPRLESLHTTLSQHPRDYSPWLERTWNCVWPVIYREQNVLKGRVDIDFVRSEIKACLAAQPRLTVWMFLFAKLVCHTQIGMGLGFCGDFSD